MSGVELAEPRVSKSGNVRYWFWEECPPHIKNSLQQVDKFKLNEEGPQARWSYTVKRNSSGGFTVFRNPLKRTEAQQQKWDEIKQMRKDVETPSSSAQVKQTDWDAVHARQEARDAEFKARHDELIEKLDNLIFAVNANTEALQDRKFRED